MRWSVIVAVVAALAGAGCSEALISPSAPDLSSAMLPVPPVPSAPLPTLGTLKVSIPSYTVQRSNNQWLYYLRVLVTETTGDSGAVVHSFSVGNHSPVNIQEDCDSNAKVYVNSGGTLDLSNALAGMYCGPAILSVDPLTSITVTVRWLGADGMLESSGSIDIS